MTDVVIRAEGLTKHYGPVVGIEDLDLEVRRGEVFGFLGPNGAGKTTTIRCLIDLLRPTRGGVQVLGLDPQRDGVELRRRVGYLPGDLALYGGMAVHEHLDWLAALRGRNRRRRIDMLVERLDLDLDRRIDDLSTGNRQKVGIVQAFMDRPDLLILDEPTRGLDPLMQQIFNELVREVRADGRTVFLSSHIMDEVEAVADRVGIVRDGNLVVTESIDELKAHTVRTVEIHFGHPVAADRFEGLPGVQEVHVDGTDGRFVVEGSMDALMKAAAELEVVTVTSREPDLEEVFLAYYRQER
jgi:ABC-2 type transport system ATP-binding protein